MLSRWITFCPIIFIPIGEKRGRPAKKDAWFPSRAIVKHYRALLSMLDNSGNSFRSLLWSLIPRWRFGSLSFDLTDHKVMPLERQSMIPPFSNVTLSTFWYFLKLVGSNFLGGVPSKAKEMGAHLLLFSTNKSAKKNVNFNKYNL